MNDVTLSIKGLTRDYKQGKEVLHVLRGLNLALKPGEIVALLGPSGTGKSTLLQAAGQLEGGYGGEIIINGNDCSKMNERQRTALRSTEIGFVYQFHHLLPDFTALENVIMPLRIRGLSFGKAKDDALEILRRLGLEGRLNHRPAELSGGEQQRVAIARALVGKPSLLLADEPTGNLDEATADIVFQELLALVRENRTAALIATHNEHLAEQMDRVVRLHDGVVAEDRAGAHATTSP